VGAERAVDELLYGSHGEHVVAVSDDAIAIEVGVERGVALTANHDVQPQGQLATVGKATEAVDAGEVGAGVVEGRHPLGQRVASRGLDPAIEARLLLRLRQLWQLRVASLHEVLRALAQQASRRP